jgi:DNA replication ATP-dependent helicase Dna2
MLTKITAGDSTVPSFGRINPEKAQGFTVRDFTRFEKAYQALSLLEKKYFNAFTGFIAREHWLAKVGEENSDSINGYASLWRSSFEDKVLNFNILSHLEIVENQADTAAHTILFRKTAQTNELANFRVGDIAVLYPSFSTGDTVLRHQVIKCSIIRLEKDRVEVQLRFQQHNLKPFQTNGLWSLEPDMLDSGFVGMYRGLLEWAETGKNTREKLLGLRVPAAPPAQQSNGLLEKIISSPDFFLLWGPPGTGKTSVLLRDIAQWVLKNTNENLLILAYTNRAVDEICEALDSIGDNVRELYLRIGGKHASSERFSGQLLSSKIAGAGNRSALREVLEKHRIFVSTVASFAQNEGLLKLKKFQRLVVDEASQILEPQLLGLLSRFEHFILIGDHRQLPAVSAQRPESSVVKDPDLNEIGLVDLRDSYFERLYLLCKRKQWHWAYDQLEQQGRMHEDIMAFPAKWFYDNGLQVFDPVHQKSALCYKLPENNSKLGAILAQKRVLFLPVSSPIPNPHQQKTSMEEATLCAEIVQCYKQLWKLNGKKWLPEKTLGIITPWRAQIAQIRSALHNAGIDPEQVTVDTVERYQGGARDIIVISTCVHSEWQLQSLLNISSEGVDRKLNVALTRAREHLIMLGNAAVLQQDERYAVFIKNHQEALENSSEIV